MVSAVDPILGDQEAEELLAELISIDTRNPPGNERPLAEFVRDWLEDEGIEVSFIHEPFENRPQILAEVGADRPDSKTLILNGHMDVVGPGSLEDWTYEPFLGTIDGDKVYGRGASDMKAGLASGMLATRAAAHSDAIDGRLILAFAVGEETGDPGTLRLIRDIDADIGVVLEPTELIVDTACKGLAWYKVTVRGEQGHASKPFLSKNPLQSLLSIGPEIEEYQERLAERTHPLLGESLCTPTVVRTEETENVIPGEAELYLDRRFLPDENVTELGEELSSIFDEFRSDGFEVEIEQTKLYEAAVIPPDAEVAEIFRRHANRIAGIDTEPHGKIAATDQRFFVNDADIPAIVWGPGSPSQAHTVDEWARIDLLNEAIEILCSVFGEVLVNE